MTRTEFVNLYMQNCQYINELSLMAAAIAEENGLVVVFGASDDLCEIRGAEDNEIDCFDGGEATIAGAKVKINWNKDGYSWTYDTDVPHECFDVYDTDGEKYCRGIVFSIFDIKASRKVFISDNEIIKALECCTKKGCSDNETKECPLKPYEDCSRRLAIKALDLINRQNSKIESLQKRLDIADEETQLAHKANIDYVIQAEKSKSEAIRAFAERLKKKTYPFPCAIGVENAVTIRAINELVEEMAGIAEKEETP